MGHAQGAIGVFDSGLGGLSALPYLRAALPKEQFIYFGDTARTPYGSKSAATIQRFSEDIVRFLEAEGVKLVVIACNTVTATALEHLQARFPQLPFVGIIAPMAEQLATQPIQTLGVIGTKLTVESQVYPQGLKALRPSMQVFQKACPILVPMIEEGLVQHPMLSLALRHYLDSFLAEGKIQDLVLGCTHYSLIRPQIEALYPRLSIHDPSEAIAARVQRRLQKEGLLAASKTQDDRFYASDLSAPFLAMIDSIVGKAKAEVRFQSLEP